MSAVNAAVTAQVANSDVPTCNTSASSGFGAKHFAVPNNTHATHCNIITRIGPSVRPRLASAESTQPAVIALMMPNGTPTTDKASAMRAGSQP